MRHCTGCTLSLEMLDVPGGIKQVGEYTSEGDNSEVIPLKVTADTSEQDQKYTSKSEVFHRQEGDDQEQGPEVINDDSQECCEMFSHLVATFLFLILVKYIIRRDQLMPGEY